MDYLIRDYSLPLTEDEALSFIKSIKEYGLIALTDPTNYSARASLMCGDSQSLIMVLWLLVIVQKEIGHPIN